MTYRNLGRLVVFILAFTILGYSLFEISGVKYAYSGKPGNYLPNPATGKNVVYDLPYPGKVLPGNPLWPIKVLRDRTEFHFAGSIEDKSKTALDLADKRLSMSLKLWNEGEVSNSIETAQKAVGYLVTSSIYARNAEENGVDVHDLVRLIVLSSLKHRQILETMLSEAPEDARPIIHSLLTDPKRVTDEMSALLTGNGFTAPINPF